MTGIIRKFLSSIIICIVFSMVFCLSSCNSKSDNENGDKNMKNIEVFGASCMYKYEQRKSFSNDEKLKEIKMNAASNEYEPAQIIISANDEEVSSYKIEVFDLMSKDGKKIEKQNIEVYSAYYNPINSSTVGYPSGYYPDILIRMEDRISYGDNKVMKGENQSIWFNIYVPQNTVAGEYKTEFVVKVNNEEYKVPVIMNVYDFELPVETHVKSAFDIWGPSHGNNMLTNIYGSRALAAENSLYEYILKYRVAADQLPGVNKNDPEAWVNQALRYAERADVPSFSIPFKIVSHETYPHWFDEQKLHDIFSLLVDRSSEELNVFDKIYAYGIVDEPDYTGHKDLCRDAMAAIQRIISTVVSEKDEEGAFVNKPSVREGLLNLRVIVTITDWSNYSEDWCSDITCFCPKYNDFDNPEFVNKFKELQNEGKGLWVYTCGSNYPYASYTVDADLENQRSTGVFQMMHNIEGNLFWCVNLSRVFDGTKYTSTWDPYSTAYAFYHSPGDGYLVAPCGKYNSRSLLPYPTMRLEMIREGQEDYEYLYLLKSLVSKKGDSAINELNSVLESEYNKLFNGSKPVEDPKVFIAFKEKVANLILANLN